MRRLLFFLLIALSGCAHAYRPAAETDPFACALRIARSLPPSASRSALFNDIAISATPCEGSPPVGFRSFDLGGEGETREANRLASLAAFHGDSATVRRESLRVLRRADAPESMRGSALERLLDFGAYDAVLDQLEIRPRVAWRDADRWRAEVAERAARAGDTNAAVRAIRSSTAGAARERTDCWARHGRVVPFALASHWTQALSEARATADCRPECRVQTLFALARAARPELADSLVRELIDEVRTNRNGFETCELDQAFSFDVVNFLGRTGRFAQAESLLVVARDGAEGFGWTKLAIWHREQGNFAAASRAIARAHEENDRPDVHGWGASRSYVAMAETLLAAGWPEEADRAHASAVAAARRESDPADRAIALGGVAAFSGANEADALVREALHTLITVKNAERQARALGRVGAGARSARVGFDEEERSWLAEMANVHPVWKPTLSE